MPPSLLERLKQQIVKTREREREPWFKVLEKLAGRIDNDGIERISTQAIFDLLGIQQARRHRGSYIRLAKVMRELGWTGVRMRDMTRGGYLEQVRGYCRDANKPRFGEEAYAKPRSRPRGEP
jgi:hypothetical protein